MPDKQSFYQEINETTVFNEDFFKKVYGYSVCDDSFLSVVASKLIKVGRKDAVQAYNEWFISWKSEYEQTMKSVAEWYQKECDKKYEKLHREHQEKEVKKCSKTKTWEIIATLLNYQLE